MSVAELERVAFAVDAIELDDDDVRSGTVALDANAGSMRFICVRAHGLRRRWWTVLALEEGVALLEGEEAATPSSR